MNSVHVGCLWLDRGIRSLWRMIRSLGIACALSLAALPLPPAHAAPAAVTGGGASVAMPGAGVPAEVSDAGAPAEVSGAADATLTLSLIHI